jgi:hypothetical protein
MLQSSECGPTRTWPWYMSRQLRKRVSSCNVMLIGEAFCAQSPLVSNKASFLGGGILVSCVGQAKGQSEAMQCTSSKPF